jgi:hypothetical protein
MNSKLSKCFRERSRGPSHLIQTTLWSIYTENWFCVVRHLPTQIGAICVPCDPSCVPCDPICVPCDPFCVGRCRTQSYNIKFIFRANWRYRVLKQRQINAPAAWRSGHRVRLKNRRSWFESRLVIGESESQSNAVVNFDLICIASGCHRKMKVWATAKKGQMPVLNFSPRGKLRPQGWSCPPGVNFVPWGWSYPLGVKYSVCPSILLNSRECSPLGVNEGVNIPPRGRIYPPGRQIHP